MLINASLSRSVFPPPFPWLHIQYLCGSFWAIKLLARNAKPLANWQKLRCNRFRVLSRAGYIRAFEVISSMQFTLQSVYSVHALLLQGASGRRKCELIDGIEGLARAECAKCSRSRMEGAQRPMHGFASARDAFVLPTRAGLEFKSTICVSNFRHLRSAMMAARTRYRMYSHTPDARIGAHLSTPCTLMQ